MPDKIDKNNVYLLLPGKVARVASILAKSRKLTPLEALTTVYRSPIYRKLEQEETKLWHFSPEQLYAMAFPRRVAGRTQVWRGPGRSVLLPYRDMILEAWQKQRLSARAIADKLATLNVFTTPQNVWKFIKTHS